MTAHQNTQRATGIPPLATPHRGARARRVVGPQRWASTLTDRCHPDALRRSSWHQDRGDRLVLASASLELYLEPLGQVLGAAHVLATRMPVEDGLLTGAVSGVNCCGPEKARQIGELISRTCPTSVWVYSDGRSDRPSLELADTATQVWPWATLPILPAPPAGHPSSTPTPGDLA